MRGNIKIQTFSIFQKKKTNHYQVMIYTNTNCITIIHMSHISLDEGKTWNEVKGHGILVLQPGAGTYTNKRAYESLEDFDEKNIITFSERYGYKYPSNWRENDQLRLPDRTTRDLVGYAKVVFKRIQKNPPEVIICGSRGSQVTIGLIWRFFWRGPTILINAGCITSKTSIPSPVFPIFITMGHDNFSTNNIKAVQADFSTLSNVSGYGYHLADQGHMPKTDALKEIFQNAVTAAKTRQKPTIVERDNLTVYELQPGEKKDTRDIQLRAKYRVQNTKFKSTLLRAFPYSNSSFIKGSAIRNDSKVIHASTMSDLGIALDEKGYEMKRVRQGNKQPGWIYSMNLFNI